MLTHGSLFSGIGGFDLGFERAGIQTIWQVENDAYAIKVLEKHWPEVKRYGDIKKIRWENVEVPDIVSGGFPCQPVSVAGKRKGTADERWLWPEFARCLRVLRPRYAVLENVPGLFVLGFGDVLGDLAVLGYNAEWDSIPAAAFGAPHLRYRVWVVAYASGNLRRTSGDVRSTPLNGGGSTVGDTRRSGQRGVNGRGARAESADGCSDVSNSRSGGWRAVEQYVLPGEPDAIRGGADVADAEGKPGEIRETPEKRQGGFASGGETANPNKFYANNRGFGASAIFKSNPPRISRGEYWAVEPDVGRVANGVSARVDRLKCLGNSIVPQIAEWLGNRIIEFNKRKNVAR